MNLETADLKTRLMETDPQFRRLVEEHRDLDRQIQVLASRVLLTSEEQLETVTLKKRKLLLKDRIEGMLERHRKVQD